ncbi:N-acetylmuramic acid 6-phosphate etherase [Natronosporangium hydrolyticum]|uniref:N-acetylmuramic acid 6-phosphate etherase n=1 Tax=Natronosporangium hydrolyticum TaxID=2811111 RepID=A0A895YLZ5_9ACTN|nr:N-acetylmuramic acid 6-phosphate etherase [Natronosporangium hydrolyticum]QSB16499.1 N-acetylmuramic acid 6-phosphate etherase [Natronosporangium hydrolyticum]
MSTRNDGTLNGLATEGRLPEAADLDLLPTSAQVALLCEQDHRAVRAVQAASEQLVTAIDAAAVRLRRGGRLIEVGAGTPGRLAVLDAAECGPTFGVEEGQVIGVMAGGSDAVPKAAENGEDDHRAGATDLVAASLTSDDVVLAVSASGRTPYVRGAIAAASAVRALTIAVVNNPDSPIAAECDLAVEALTGPEVISGSTRLKAGTAQKLVLNTFSTLLMVKLGHTYGDLMVNVRASNTKLRWRSQRIVAEAAGVDTEQAAEALTEAGGQAKVATVMLLAGVDAATARSRLTAAAGHVRAAVAGSAAP